MIKSVMKITKDAHLCKVGQKVVFIHGEKEESVEETNSIKILEIE